MGLLIKFWTIISCEISILNQTIKVLDKKINQIKENGLDSSDKRVSLPLKMIQEYASKDKERLRIIEDKAKVTTTGITIALSVFVVGSTQLSIDMIAPNLIYKVLDKIVDSLSVFSVLYFLLAGYYSLKAIRVKEIFQVSLHDELNFKNDIEKQIRYLEILDLNRKVITKYTNYVEVSFNAIRNGIATIALLILILTVANNLSIAKDINDEYKSIPKSNEIKKEKVIIIIEENNNESPNF